MAVENLQPAVEVMHKGESPIYGWPAHPKLKLGALGIDPPQGDVERGMQQTLRKFALEVARPVGQCSIA